MNSIAAFHFIRPWWLLLMIPAGWVWYRALKSNDALQAWRLVMAPHLLEVLTLDPGRQNTSEESPSDSTATRPVTLLGSGLMIAIIALAGPSWKMQDTPFAQDQAAVFIVMYVGETMLAQDIQPSRLQRAQQKVSDFLTARAGTRAGLVAYAGTAHLAMPLTGDPEVINNFARALDPAVMPVPGNNVMAAVSLADERLSRAETGGSILLVTDAVDPADLDAMKRYKKAGGAPVHILAAAADAEVIPPPGSPPAPPLNLENLNAAADAMGGSVTVLTADDSDVIRLARQVERGIRPAPAQEGQQWQDMGVYLVWLLALVMLVFFRRGGAVVWR